MTKFSQWLKARWASISHVAQWAQTECFLVSKCKPNDPIADSLVGSTVTPDPVDQTERPIQTDVMKIAKTDGPASLFDTPPSSDSGIHSWGEQWENMSISTSDTEAEQNVRPRICSPTGRRGSDTRVPPNTEEDEDIICPWMDCLLKGESDESSSSEIQNYNKDPQYNENMDYNSDQNRRRTVRRGRITKYTQMI